MSGKSEAVVGFIAKLCRCMRASATTICGVFIAFQFRY